MAGRGHGARAPAMPRAGTGPLPPPPPPPTCNAHTTQRSPAPRQVEVNTIASSFAALSQRVTAMHKCAAPASPRPRARRSRTSSACRGEAPGASVEAGPRPLRPAAPAGSCSGGSGSGRSTRPTAPTTRPWPASPRPSRTRRRSTASARALPAPLRCARAHPRRQRAPCGSRGAAHGACGR